MKRTVIGLASVAVLAALGISWYVAGLLVNKPIAQRYDFCSDKATTCLKNVLEKYQLKDKEIKVNLVSFDGTQLKGSYFPSTNGAAVIVQHGYGGHRGSVMHIAAMLQKHGFGTLVMDLRAHGESSGELVTFGRDESKDMQIVFDYLKNRADVDGDKIGIYGWSLGGATVLLHGDMNKEVKAVVADSPFDAINYANLAEFTDLPWPMPALITSFTSMRSGVDYELEAPIAHLDAYPETPLFLMIAGADQVVDAGSGERLLAKLDAKKVKVWREPTFGHVRFSFDAPVKFEIDIVEFYNHHLSPISNESIGQ